MFVDESCKGQEEYRYWRGIVFLFGRDGALERNEEPKKSGCGDEEQAYKLKQKHIYSPIIGEICTYLELAR